jgi:hypothetical protein
MSLLNISCRIFQITVVCIVSEYSIRSIVLKIFGFNSPICFAAHLFCKYALTWLSKGIMRLTQHCAISYYVLSQHHAKTGVRYLEPGLKQKIQVFFRDTVATRQLDPFSARRRARKRPDGSLHSKNKGLGAQICYPHRFFTNGEANLFQDIGACFQLSVCMTVDPCTFLTWLMSASLKDVSLSRCPKDTDSTRTRYGERRFSFSAPTFWNQIPDSIQRASSLTTFKKLLKTYLVLTRMIKFQHFCKAPLWTSWNGRYTLVYLNRVCISTQWYLRNARSQTSSIVGRRI